MAEIIKTYLPGSEVYERLTKVANIMTAGSVKGRKYEVKDTYFDFGQNWKWTTICYEDDWCGVQVLSPKDLEDIIYSDNLIATTAGITNDKYWSDK